MYASHFGVREYMHFNHKVQSVRYNNTAKHWVATVSIFHYFLLSSQP